MSPLDAAHELLNAHADYSRMVALHARIVNKIAALRGTPDRYPALYRTQTVITKRLSLAQTRLESAREMGCVIASAFLANVDVCRGLADRVAAQSELLSKCAENTGAKSS